MAYEVLARKWRPQQFDDVVGQDHVTRTLRNAIAQRRIANAYLFVGPRGTGKTSLARIFAKALNCRKGPTETPCDQCPACLEIAAGRSIDVLEIDGASNTGVDQVRDLRENVKYAPASASYKIYIIDEVHMLSTPAFNALLKTLEEPPPHVKFVFATTEPQKILATILSRCQRFDLRRIPAAQIVERLALIAKAETITIGNDALLAIARGAEGGLRDAESALDQLTAYCGNTIAEADVLASFGLVARQALESLAAAVFRGDVAAVIGGIGELDKAGKDMSRLLVDLLDLFRNVLVFAYAGEPALDVLETQAEGVKTLAALLPADRLLRMVDLLVQAEERMRFALSRRTVMETTLLRCARLARVATVDELLRRVEALQAGGGGGDDEDGGAGVVREATPPAPAPSTPAPGAAGSPAGRAAPPPPPPRPAGGSRPAGGPATASSAAAPAAPAVSAEDDAAEAGAPADDDPPAAADDPAPAPAAPPAGGRNRRTAQDWLRDPTVRKALEMFNGSIADVRG